MPMQIPVRVAGLEKGNGRRQRVIPSLSCYKEVIKVGGITLNKIECLRQGK